MVEPAGTMVQWWEEWQLRVLVLTSLFLQCFLFFSATFRKHRIPAILRASIWLAYLGSDAVAIYGLAAIFSRHGGAATGDMSSSMLEVLWAPIFLIHLAGAQDSITAYDAAEDNALWARRAVAMSSQAAVAVYVFCRSWSGGKVRARCPVALFVAGFLKMGRTLWAHGFTARSRWSTKIDSDLSRRYSLVRTCQTVLSRIATLLRCNNQHWYYGEHSPWTEKVVDLIREDLRCGWVEDDLRSAAAYRRFNDRRGQWTLWREQCYGEMGWSVAKLPFDEAVLVWHVATDICLHCTEYINISSSPVAGADKITAVMKISNYMMYLLAFQPQTC